jgi:hypothetical protein
VTPEELRDASPLAKQMATMQLATMFGAHLVQIVPVIGTIQDDGIDMVFDAMLAVKDSIEDLCVLLQVTHNVVPT